MERMIKGKTIEQWKKIEKAEHDELYNKAYPFGLDSYEFTVEHVLWYEDYAYKKGRRRDRGNRTKLFLRLVELDTLVGKRVLDIGCGIGQYSVLCAKCGAIVTAVDLSEVGPATGRKMAEANKVADRCKFISGQVTELDLPDKHFDIVLLHEVLHHAIKYPALKETLMRVTKNKGRIVVADTVKGAGIIHMGRKIVKFARYRGRPDVRASEENLGDILFDLNTYREFAQGFGKFKIYRMSYFYMVKQTFLQYHTDKWSVRFFLRMMKYLDDISLSIFPAMREGCGEAVLCIERDWGNS